MKILINTATTYKGGGVQVANSFIHECRKHLHNEYYVVLSGALKKKIKTDDFPQNFFFYEIPYRPARRVFSVKSASAYFKKIERKTKPDVVFTTSGPAYWRPIAQHLTGFNLPHHIYVDSPFFNILTLKKKLRWFAKRNLSKFFLKRDSDAYVVQTKEVNYRLSRWLKNQKPIYTVSNTCSHYFFNPKTILPKLPRKKMGDIRFLLLSAYYRHKDIEIISRIVKKLPESLKNSIQFVVTLEVNVYHQLFEKLVQKNVLNVGPIKLEEAPSLYQECDALFMPTLLECFSASYPEAMAMKKPIITTDLGFAKEICRDAAIYYKPMDAHDAVKKIDLLVGDKILQENLIMAGLKRLNEFPSPEERASAYLNICETLHENNTGTA